MITCEQCRDEMPEYALGHSEPASASAMAAHLTSCVVCRRELAEVETAWSALPESLEPHSPRPAVFERVSERIDRAQGARPATTRPIEGASPLTTWQRVMSYVLAASVLVALIAGSLYVRRAGDGAGVGDVAADRALHDLAQRLGKVQELEQMLKAGNVRLASLRPASHGKAAAYVVWDLANGQWHFYALNLPAPPSGQIYQLWAVAEGQEPVAGPTFDVARGLGKTVADFPKLTATSKVTATVTLEPAGGSASPTGAVILESPLS